MGKGSYQDNLLGRGMGIFWNNTIGKSKIKQQSDNSLWGSMNFDSFWNSFNYQPMIVWACRAILINGYAKMGFIDIPLCNCTTLYNNYYNIFTIIIICIFQLYLQSLT